MIMESVLEKLVTTAVIYFLFLQLAIRFGIFGPTILDLKHHLNVNQAKMSIVFSVTSLGVCVGSISSGFLFKRIPKQIGLASIVVMLGIIVTFVAKIEDYYVFSVLQFIIGVTSGVAINECEAWILEIWGKSCPPYMQALQFFRGLGYILGPIIAEPFLALELEDKLSPEDMPTTISSLVGADSVSNETIGSTEDPIEAFVDAKSRIYIPFMINGLMLILGAVMVGLQYLYVLRKSRSKSVNMTASSEATIVSTVSGGRHYSESNSENEKEAETSGQSKLFTYSIIILCSVFYLFFFEEVVVTYLASFSTNIALKLSKSRGAFLTSIFNLSNVIGKAISIVLALKLKHFTMLYMNLVIILISLVILMIYSNTSLVMLWVGVCLLGVGFSSIIASLFSLMKSTIAMDSMVCGILNMSGTLGSVVTPLAIASYIETYPLSMIIASLFCAVSCLVIMIAIHLLIHFRHKKVNQMPIIREKSVNSAKSEKF